MFENLDDPDILIGKIVALATIGAIGWLIFQASKERPPSRVTIGAGLSLLAFAWFLCWLISSGSLPYGLPALGTSIVVLCATLAIGNRRQ